jgi:hypothetical protein
MRQMVTVAETSNFSKPERCLRVKSKQTPYASLRTRENLKRRLSPIAFGNQTISDTCAEAFFQA